MAYPNLSDIVTTTLENRSGKLADNLSNNNGLLFRLNQKGNIRPISGGTVIMQEIMYNDPNTDNSGSYSGYDTIDTTPDSPISAAEFAIKQYASSVNMSGMEMLQNSGKEQVIDLLESRITIAETRLKNRISLDLYGDGTGNGGKNITGLAAAITATPGSGTYGGISRAAWTFWRNQYFGATANGGAAATPANIMGYMTQLALLTMRGRDHADLIVADNTAYAMYNAALQNIQRVTSDGSASGVGGGFSSLKFYGAGMSADVIADGGIGGHAPAGSMYFLNTDYIFLRPHTKRNFVPFGGDRQSINQDAMVKLYGWAGNLTSNGLQFQGLLTLA